MDPTSVKQHQNFFLSAAKRAVAIAHHYFYSVTGAIEPVLNLTDSDATNKVAVAHLW